MFEHIIHCKSTNEIWQTFDRLFNKKDVARLQLLENQLANASQGDFSIAQFFLKIKNLCSKISALDQEEPIFEACMRQHVICGLRPEYIPYVTSIQGWAQQPSLEEFESFLSSQESLAMQMARLSVSEKSGDTDNKNVLLTERKKNFNPKGKKSDSKSSNNASNSSNFKKEKFKCYRCGKLGHMKKNCRVKLKQGNWAEAKKTGK
ncbi:hypothetical protein L6164_013315 [Bauhinia variegata]|uniref:Uncharacterized protein n=1 Tax=Bauhinia variegata TaxID=167791 RepID=A0ACB9PDV5_BAUVA|nr:hypothetical protein L6164_013315 [Bauhinia variegata]